MNQILPLTKNHMWGYWHFKMSIIQIFSNAISHKGLIFACVAMWLLFRWFFWVTSCHSWVQGLLTILSYIIHHFISELSYVLNNYWMRSIYHEITSNVVYLFSIFHGDVITPNLGSYRAHMTISSRDSS